MKNKNKNRNFLLLIGILVVLFPFHFNLPPIEFQSSFVKLIFDLCFNVVLIITMIISYKFIKDESNVMVYTLFVGLPIIGLALVGLVFITTTHYRDGRYYTTKNQEIIIYQNIPRGFAGGYRYIKAQPIVSGVRWFEEIELTLEERNNLIRLKNKPARF